MQLRWMLTKQACPAAPLRALSSAPCPCPLAIGHQVDSDSFPPETGSKLGTEPFHGQIVPEVQTCRSSAHGVRGVRVSTSSAGRARSDTVRCTCRQGAGWAGLSSRLHHCTCGHTYIPSIEFLGRGCTIIACPATNGGASATKTPKHKAPTTIIARSVGEPPRDGRARIP